jgi:hypothetical protein
MSFILTDTCPSAEERNASVSEFSVGKNLHLFGNSDVPTLVTNNESRQHNPLTLENSALGETLHFKQDGSVVQQSTIKAGEISRPTANTFGEKYHLSTGEQQ